LIDSVSDEGKTAELGNMEELRIHMDKDAQIMKMGLVIKACINATCLFTRKVFDGTEVPGKNKKISHGVNPIF
jgi:hypothetical protein